jgi:hypothetical protein
MKKIFTLLLSSLFSLSLLAYDGSRLSVSTFTASNMDFRVEVDGKRFNMVNNSITISTLSAGQHNVRIYREMKRGRGNGFGFGRKSEIIYASTLFLRRGYHLDITINRFGKALVDEHKIVPDDDWSDYDGDFDGDYDNNWHGQYSQVMSAGEFESVKQAISKEWMESSKLQSVKTIVENNRFSTQQVKDLMCLFQFESNRLEVAKMAYHNTVDKNNFYEVNDVLSFSSSRDDLARFIRESR